jgi:hypothetical protein
MAALFVLYAVFATLSFKLAAGSLGAPRRGWLRSSLAMSVAVLLLLFAWGCALLADTSEAAALAAAVLLSGATNRLLLRTTYLRGAAITAIGAIGIPSMLFVGWWLGGKIFSP